MWGWLRPTHRTPHWVSLTHRTPHWGAWVRPPGPRFMPVGERRVPNPPPHSGRDSVPAKSVLSHTRPRFHCRVRSADGGVRTSDVRNPPSVKELPKLIAAGGMIG